MVVAEISFLPNATTYIVIMRCSYGNDRKKVKVSFKIDSQARWVTAAPASIAHLWIEMLFQSISGVFHHVIYSIFIKEKQSFYKEEWLRSLHYRWQLLE